MKLALLGGGNMGQAIILALLQKKIVKPAEILVYDPNAEKRVFFARQHISTTTTDYARLKDYDVLILAVKPQDMKALLDATAPSISPKTLVVSIMTGITIKSIAHYLKHHRIVRTMPNTPAQIQMGITGWAANRRVTAPDKKIVQRILAAMGEAIYFADEKHLDAVTALSASGPAYVFYFIEAMIAGGKACGLPEKIAQQLTLQTFIGASHLLAKTGESPALLRERVTSKKGTTDAALRHLNGKKTQQIIEQAVQAAWKRAKELAR